MEGESSIDNAIVSFGDGKRAKFSRVEFFPDGRLKASLKVSITDDGRSRGEVTTVAYYAAGAWVSVEPPQEGVLIATSTRTDATHVVASGITEAAAFSPC